MNGQNIKRLALAAGAAALALLQRAGRWWLATFRSAGNRGKVLFGCGSLLAGCFLISFCMASLGLLPDPTPTPLAIAAAAEETAAISEIATEEVLPTDTPVPTNTPEPTATESPTPRPTDTPAPTNTPRPTNTPVPTLTPSPTPEPIVLTGSGDSIVDIEKGTELALVRITGNSASRHFAVTNYDANGEQIDLLVNTTEPYEGVRPLDFLDGEYTATFEVTATGEWTIEVLPFGSVEQVDAPADVTGEGDYVFVVLGTPRRATISGNTAARHFAVQSYSSSGIDLLVNTTDPYDGTVMLGGGSVIIEVTAEGPWTISITD